MDGEEPYWAWDAAYDMLGFGIWSDYIIEPRDSSHTLLTLSVEQDVEISEIYFTFDCDPGDGSWETVFSRVTLPEPATVLELSSADYPVERLSVTNGAA